VPGDEPIVSLGRALADMDHVGDAPPAFGGLAARLAQGSAGAQTGRQLPAQRPAALHVQALTAPNLSGGPRTRLSLAPYLGEAGRLSSWQSRAQGIRFRWRTSANEETVEQNCDEGLEWLALSYTVNDRDGRRYPPIELRFPIGAPELAASYSGLPEP
jgi:hypothetical protein